MSHRSARTRVLRVRVTDSEMASLRADAEALGTSVSSLVRSLCVLPREVAEAAVGASEGDGSALVRIVYDRSTYPRLLRQIRAYGYHVNQAVRALNTIALKNWMSQEDAYRLLEESNRRLGEIEDLRELVQAALEDVAQAELVRLGR